MDYKDLNDYEVVYMIRENDDDAREIIFNKYIPIVKRIASNYLSYAKLAKIEYDDLVQEGLIALNIAINKYNEETGPLFYTFVSVCVERRIITYCRRMSSSKHYVLNNALSDDSLYGVCDDKTPEFYFNERCLDKEFIHFKNMFNFNESCIFELRYNGFSYKEISSLLDIPVTTIDGRLYKIRKILHNKIKKAF